MSAPAGAALGWSALGWIALGWIWDDNAPVFIDDAAARSGYELAPEELDAYIAEIHAGDAERDAWCEIALGDCALRMAIDPGTSVVQVMANGPDARIAELRVLVEFMACYAVGMRS